MAEKLSIEIALQGGAEVERQLADIGAAGEQAFAQIEQSAAQVGGFKNLKPEVVTAKLKGLGIEGTAAFGKIQNAVATAGRFEKVVLGVQSMETAFVALGRAAGPVGLAIAAALTSAVKATISFAQEISKATTEATKLGLTVTQFDQMRRNMEQLGISSQTAGQGIKAFSQVLEQSKIDSVNKAFKELQEASARGFGATGTQQLRVLQEAAQGTGKAAEFAAEKLKELGQAVPPNAIAEQFKKISDSIAGLSRADAAAAVIRALQAIEDPALRAALAMKFFGDAGAELAQKLQTGAAGAATFRSAVGNLITPEDAAKADELDSAINRLGASLTRFGSVSIAPAITPVINTAAAAVDNLNAKLTQNPWGTYATGAQTALNPVGGVLTMIIGQLFGTGQAAAQAGQAVAQAGQQGAQGLQLITNPLTGMPQLILATNQALAQTGQAGAQAGQQAAQGFQVWNEELGKAVPAATQAGAAVAQAGQQGTSAWQTLPAAVDQAIASVTNFVSTMGTIAWDTISSVGVSAWDAITGAIQTAIDALLKFIGLKPSTPATGGGASGMAGGGLLGGRGTGTSDSNLAWLSRGEYIMPARAVAKPGVLSFLEALRRSGRIPGFAAGGLVGGGGTETITVGVNNIAKAIERQTEAIASQSNVIIELGRMVGELGRMVGDLVNNVAGLADQQSQMVGAFNDLMQFAKRNAPRGKAGGGLLGGRGTGTSDSNLAWVSRGEHIMPARAVAQPGVLLFLEALRRSGGNLSRVLDGMGRFALGGLVPRAIPAFAMGGLAGGMSNVTIQFPGLPAIGGLRASSGVVDQLQKAAALAQVRSGGRKPSRYS